MTENKILGMKAETAKILLVVLGMLVTSLFFVASVKSTADEALTQSTPSLTLTQNGVTDHGALSGLSDDDHTQYTKADGTRDFTGKVSYDSHPTFTSDTEIVDKKYVDDYKTGGKIDHKKFTEHKTYKDKKGNIVNAVELTEKIATLEQAIVELREQLKSSNKK